MSLVFTTLYMMELYIDLAVKFGVVSSNPRTAGRQRNRANPHVADTKDYWWIILYYQFLDHLLNELRCRFGEKCRSISGTGIDSYQFKQTKTDRRMN